VYGHGHGFEAAPDLVGTRPRVELRVQQDKKDIVAQSKGLPIDTA